MKQINTNFLISLLIAVCVSSLSFLTVKAQNEAHFVPNGMQYKSSVIFDVSDNPIDSTIFIWSSKGYPVAKETYLWDNGQKILSATGKIVADNGNEIKVELTSIDGEDEIVLPYTYKFNDKGYITEMIFVFYFDETPIEIVSKFQYWETANRLDSIEQVISSPMGVSSVRLKYRSYDANGRPTLVEERDMDLGSYSLQKYVYDISASGKLLKAEMQTADYSPAGDLLSQSMDVTYYDSEERMIKVVNYSGTAEEVDAEYFQYTIFHYGTNAGITTQSLLDQQVTVSTTNDYLSVNSPKSERITIYNMLGAQMYVKSKKAGETQISMSNFPQGIYLVTGGSGWIKKIKK
jgi:hypothetical protein